MQHHVLWQTINQVSSLDFHWLLIFIWICRTDLNLDVFRSAVTDKKVVFFLYILNNCRVKLIAAHSYRTGSNDTAQRDNCNFAGTAADINDHASGSFCNWKTCTDCCSHWLFNDCNGTCACFQGCFLNCTALNCGNAGWNADNHARTCKNRVVACFFDEDLQHACGNIKVSDNAVF